MLNIHTLKTNVYLGQNILFEMYTYDLRTMMAFDLKHFDVRLNCLYESMYLDEHDGEFIQEVPHVDSLTVITSEIFHSTHLMLLSLFLLKAKTTHSQ